MAVTMKLLQESRVKLVGVLDGLTRVHLMLPQCQPFLHGAYEEREARFHPPVVCEGEVGIAMNSVSERVDSSMTARAQRSGHAAGNLGP